MNKRLSKIVLALTIGLIATTSIYLGISNKSNQKIVDIKGNRQALEGMNIVYQENEGMYKTKSVKISKDNLEIENYAKEVPYDIPSTKENIKDRDLLKNISYQEQTYQDDKSKGHVQLNENYDDYSSVVQHQYTAYVTDKNLQTNEITSYEIPIKASIKDDNETNYTSVAIKYQGNLYLVVNIDIQPNYISKEEEQIHASKECLINVYKLNLENESSEQIFSQKMSDKEKLASIGNITFSHKDKVYMTINRYNELENKKYETKYDLVEYDLKTNKINIREIPTSIKNQSSLDDYCIDGNKVSFMSYDYDKKVSTDIYKLTIDLDNKKILSNDKYTVKNEQSSFISNVAKVKVANNKIYLITQQYPDDDKINSSQVYTQYVHVIDEKTKETLYTGKVYEEIGRGVEANIVNEEI